MHCVSEILANKK